MQRNGTWNYIYWPMTNTSWIAFRLRWQSHWLKTNTQLLCETKVYKEHTSDWRSERLMSEIQKGIKSTFASFGRAPHCSLPPSTLSLTQQPQPSSTCPSDTAPHRSPAPTATDFWCSATGIRRHQPAAAALPSNCVYRSMRPGGLPEF